MKVTPSNQTLILAGEQVPPSGKPGMAGGPVQSTVNGAVLRRVTMVAAWPDSTVVYVRADYAPPAAASPGSVVATQPKSVESAAVPPSHFGLGRIAGGSRDVYGNRQTLSGQVGLSSYLRPEEQYAQTQRLLADVPRTAHLDVHA